MLPPPAAPGPIRKPKHPMAIFAERAEHPDCQWSATTIRVGFAVINHLSSAESYSARHNQETAVRAHCSVSAVAVALRELSVDGPFKTFERNGGRRRHDRGKWTALPSHYAFVRCPEAWMKARDAARARRESKQVQPGAVASSEQVQPGVLIDPSGVPAKQVQGDAVRVPTSKKRSTHSKDQDHSPGGETAHRFALRLAYNVLQMHPETEADAADLLKTDLARYGVPYDGRKVAQLLDEAGYVRRKREATCSGN